MAFVDDFSGSANDAQLEDHTPSGGIAWTLGVEGRRSLQVVSGRLASNDLGGGSRGYWLCDDQGSADHFTSGKWVGISPLDTELAVRIVDEDNHVTLYTAGSGGAGRRLTKRVAGSSTDLVTSQPVSGEWRKLEAEGDKYRMYAGGTGASPVWALAGSEQTVLGAEIPTTETSQGVIGGTISGGVNNLTHSYFEAASLVVASALTLTSITPATGPSTGGTTVTMTGTGFEAGTVPKFNGVDATSVTIVSDTELTCVTPAI